MSKTVEPSFTPLKLLCNYGGRILPCGPSGQLRYVGGEIRVLSIDRSIEFTDLLAKLGQLCGSSVSLRCQLPKEDLDLLVTIASHEELALIIQEYDHACKTASSQLKIRAFLSPPKPMKKISPPPSAVLDEKRRYSIATKRAQSITLHTRAIRNLTTFSKFSRMQRPYYQSFSPRLPTTPSNCFFIQRPCVAF